MSSVHSEQSYGVVFLVYRCLPRHEETISQCQVMEVVEGTDLHDVMVSHMTHEA